MMHRTPALLLVLMVAMAGIVPAARGQQATDSATAPAAPKNPTPDTMKKARMAGYHAKLRKGETLFCKEETEIGSHFSKENCIDETQLLVVLDRQQAQRDQLTNHTCTGCSGK
jgi:hypothetical protein